MQTWLPPSELPFAEQVLVQNVSHDFHANDSTGGIYFHTNSSHKESFCHRGKSKLGIGLFIHELLREPLIILWYGMHGPLACFVLYRLHSQVLCFSFIPALVVAYSLPLSVQSLLIAYFCRCVQCTRYCCRHCFWYLRNGLCCQFFISLLYRFVDSVSRFFSYRKIFGGPSNLAPLRPFIAWI